MCIRDRGGLKQTVVTGSVVRWHSHFHLLKTFCQRLITSRRMFYDYVEDHLLAQCCSLSNMQAASKSRTFVEAKLYVIVLASKLDLCMIWTYVHLKTLAWHHFPNIPSFGSICSYWTYIHITMNYVNYFVYVACKVQLTLFCMFILFILSCCKCCMGPIRTLVPMGTVHSNNNIDWLIDWLIYIFV